MTKPKKVIRTLKSIIASRIWQQTFIKEAHTFLLKKTPLFTKINSTFCFAKLNIKISFVKTFQHLSCRDETAYYIFDERRPIILRNYFQNYIRYIKILFNL